MSEADELRDALAEVLTLVSECCDCFELSGLSKDRKLEINRLAWPEDQYPPVSSPRIRGKDRP